LDNKPHETLVFRSSPALVRYDARGNGLSDRIIDEISFDAFVGDLETVADAAKVTRFALLGISQGLRGHRAATAGERADARDARTR
jgi:pimeloyl-ACP methyl ester carboxylesterase